MRAPLSLNRSAAGDPPPAGPSPCLPPKPVSTSTIPGGSVLTSPISAAPRSPATDRSAASAASARLRGHEGDELALVGHVHRVDARGSPPRRPPPGRTGTSASRTIIATLGGARQLVEHRGHAAAGGVAHAAQRGPGLLEQRVDRRPQGAGVGLDLGAASSNSPRASMIAVPCSPTVPETRMRSPGRSAAGGQLGARVAPAQRRSCRRTSRRRGRARRPWCRRPRSRRPRRRAAAAIASTSARSSSAGRPSSRISDRLSASGRAPDTARSLTVPFTASSPIEPPGKRIGLTTKLSVVMASCAPSTSTAPASPIAAPVAEPKAGHEQPLDHASGSPCRRRRGTS